MNWVHLYLGFRGRIGRRTWWIGFLVLTLIELIGIHLLDPDYFGGTGLASPTLPHLIWSLLLTVPAAALIVKRFNDRDFPWWWGFAFAGLSSLYGIAEYAGYFLDPVAMTTAEHLAFWPFLVATLVVLVDNGFMRGTPGPNSYGPDPLAGDARVA